LATVFAFSHAAVIRVYDETGNVINTHEHKGEFKDCWGFKHEMVRGCVNGSGLHTMKTGGDL
jgi:hypothetical protein